MIKFSFKHTPNWSIFFSFEGDFIIIILIIGVMTLVHVCIVLLYLFYTTEGLKVCGLPFTMERNMKYQFNNLAAVTHIH